MEELLALGIRQVPIVSRGGEWVNGQSLKDVARLIGIDLGTIKRLPPAELVRRIDLVIEGAARFFTQLPEEHLGDLLPRRPRSYAQLAWHLFNVADAWLDHEQGIALKEGAYSRDPPKGTTRDQILTYGDDVRRRLAQWWEGAQVHTDWSAKADVYYGNVSRHEFLERTTWHSGQHARQLMWLLQDKFAIEPDRPLGPETWAGLPMPEQVWDS